MLVIIILTVSTQKLSMFLFLFILKGLHNKISGFLSAVVECQLAFLIILFLKVATSRVTLKSSRIIIAIIDLLQFNVMIKVPDDKPGRVCARGLPAAGPAARRRPICRSRPGSARPASGSASRAACPVTPPLETPSTSVPQP